jgi:uncharacterized protein YdaU (DUF1376 family)
MSEYFSHDYDAREDEKIQNLIFKYGMEGYGIYWSIIEMLYKNDGYMQTHYERIAYVLHTDIKKIENIIKDFGLFEINENAFNSNSVLHRLKIRSGKTFSAKKAAKARWDKAKANNANAMQTQCKRNAKKKRKVNKENKIKEESSHLFEYDKNYDGFLKNAQADFESGKIKEEQLKAYRGFVNFLFGRSKDNNLKFELCLSLRTQIDYAKFVKLFSKFDKELIKAKIKAMENWSGNLENRTFYLTLDNWCSGDSKRF